eukprot:345650-Chlamydomonas_euryale.AAC.2
MSRLRAASAAARARRPTGSAPASHAQAYAPPPPRQPRRRRMRAAGRCRLRRRHASDGVRPVAGVRPAAAHPAWPRQPRRTCGCRAAARFAGPCARALRRCARQGGRGSFGR